MFEHRLKLFTLMGFEVRIDASWIVIAVLVVWSLSTGLFPFEYADLPTRTYWLMGAFGAIGLFLSIIIHEFAHSLVARKYGMPMKGITLFIFGGVAEMKDEPSHPKHEFLMAIVGPLTSIGLAILFYFVYAAGIRNEWPAPLNGVSNYLSFINILLAIFNLLPAFPLDGGRVLRSILWYLKGNVGWATRVASTIGSSFGILLIAYGFWRMFNANLIGGMWMVLIGIFLHNAAKASYQQLLVRKALEGESVRRFMKLDPVTVSPSASIEQLVEDYIYRHHHKIYPVVDSEKLLGCVLMEQVKEIPREERRDKTVSDLMRPCSKEITIDPQTDAVQLLSMMNKTGSSRYMVVEDGRLVGVISSRDMLNLLSLKVELEQQQ
jgi:Zn-dependent protease/CBS domain-containing protein